LTTKAPRAPRKPKNAWEAKTPKWNKKKSLANPAGLFFYFKDQPARFFLSFSELFKRTFSGLLKVHPSFTFNGGKCQTLTVG